MAHRPPPLADLRRPGFAQTVAEERSIFIRHLLGESFRRRNRHRCHVPYSSIAWHWNRPVTACGRLASPLPHATCAAWLITSQLIASVMGNICRKRLRKWVNTTDEVYFTACMGYWHGPSPSSLPQRSLCSPPAAAAELTTATAASPATSRTTLWTPCFVPKIPRQPRMTRLCMPR